MTLLEILTTAEKIRQYLSMTPIEDDQEREYAEIIINGIVREYVSEQLTQELNNVDQHSPASIEFFNYLISLNTKRTEEIKKERP